MSQLGPILVHAGVLTQQQLGQLQQEAARTRQRMTQILLRFGVDSKVVANALAQASRLPRLEAQDLRLGPNVAEMVSDSWALRHGIAPLWVEAPQTLVVAVTDPTMLGPLDELSFRTGLRVKPLLASEAELADVMVRLFGQAADPRHPRPEPVGHPSEPPRPSYAPPSAPPPPMSADPALMQQLRALHKLQNDTAAELGALLELCVLKGLIQRDDYVDRLHKLD